MVQWGRSIWNSPLRRLPSSAKVVADVTGSEKGSAAQTLPPPAAKGREAQWQEKGEPVIFMDVSLGDSFLSHELTIQCFC